MRWLLAILAVALLLRLVLLPGADVAPFGDAADYDRYGVSLAQAGVFPVTGFADPGGPTALRPPGYPLLLGGVYEVFGRDLTAARAVNAGLGAVAVLLLYLLVARVWDRRRALWAAGIAAVLPSLALLGGGLLSENLFVPLVLGVALLVALQRERGGLALAGAAGALLGLATLTRSTGLVLLLPVLVGLWRGSRAAPAVAVAALLVVLTPWTIRNADEFGRFLPLGTQGGYTLAGQWNGDASKPGRDRAAWALPESVVVFSDLFAKPGIDEGDVDAELRARALDFALQRPTIVPIAAAINVERSLHLPVTHDTLDSSSFTELGAARAGWPWLRIGAWALFVLVIAAVALRQVRRDHLWLWLFPVTLFAGYVLWLGAPRYRIPVDAFLVIPAALAAVAVLRPDPPIVVAPPLPGDPASPQA